MQGCVTLCRGDSGCQSACRANKPCGASNPTRVNVTSTPTGSGPGKTSGASTTGNTVGEDGFQITGTAPPGSGNDNAASSLLEVGSVYGMGLLVAGLAAGVAIVGF